MTTEQGYETNKHLEDNLYSMIIKSLLQTNKDKDMQESKHEQGLFKTNWQLGRMDLPLIVVEEPFTPKVPQKLSDIKVIVQDDVSIMRIKALDQKIIHSLQTQETMEHKSLIVNHVEMNGVRYPVVRVKVSTKPSAVNMGALFQLPGGVLGLQPGHQLVLFGKPSTWARLGNYGTSFYGNSVNIIDAAPLQDLPVLMEETKGGGAPVVWE
jgi:hypothetical protein